MLLLLLLAPNRVDDIELNSNLEMKLLCFLVDRRCSAMLTILFAVGELDDSNGLILFSTDDAVALSESCKLEMLEENAVVSAGSDCSEEVDETFEKALIKLGLSLSIGFRLYF